MSSLESSIPKIGSMKMATSWMKPIAFFVSLSIIKRAFAMVLPKIHKKVSYRDLGIRIPGSILISYLIDAVGRADSLFVRITTLNFYIDLVGGFLMTFLVWGFIRHVVIFLDQRWDWLRQTAVRLIVQVVLAVFLPSLLSFLLTFGYMRWMWQQDIFVAEWLNNEFFMVVILIVFINLYYFTYWLYLSQQPLNAPSNVSATAAPHAEETHKPAKTAFRSGAIEVTKGEKIRLIPQAEIAYAYLKDSYCYIRKFDAELFITTYALDDLFGLLEEEHFFRINRQMIINRKAITSYSSIEHGKIAIDVEPVLKEKGIVSQKRAKAFREWISYERK